LSKNDHFRALLEQAPTRGFQPARVAFDRWDSRLDNLKWVRDWGWDGLTRIKRIRPVSLRAGEQQAVSQLDLPATGLTVHRRGYGWVKVLSDG
jgi:hypothetical protein